MNISTLVPKTAKITAAAAGAVLAGSLMSGTAEAGSWWQSYGVKGVHAQGFASRKNGRSYVKGYVKDTACDGRVARLRIAFGGSFPRTETVTARQCGAVTPFDFNSQHRPVRVTECVTRWNRVCGPAITIIP